MSFQISSEPPRAAALLRSPLGLIVLGLAALTLVLAALMAGRLLLPPGDYRFHDLALGSFLTWDGLWYREVALIGYQWTALGSQPLHYTDLDFFPLWPLLDRIMLAVTHARQGMILLSMGFWFAGGAALFRFAREQFDSGTALFVLMVYCLWPSSLFGLMGYPVGLILLCAVESIRAYARGHRLRAALWSGLGTAVAPVAVFQAAALCGLELWSILTVGGVLHIEARRCRVAWSSLRQIGLPAVLRFLAFGLLTVGGLLLFMLYLWIVFGDPVLFTKAQLAWSTPPAPLWRLFRMVNPFWYILPLGDALGLALGYIASTPAHIINAIELVCQMGVFFLTAFLLWRHRTLAATHAPSVASNPVRAAAPLAVVWWAGLATMLGYAWFIVTTQNMVATARIVGATPFVYMVLGQGLAGFSGQSKKLSKAVAIAACSGVFVFLLANSMFLTAGYPVL